MHRISDGKDPENGTDEGENSDGHANEDIQWSYYQLIGNRELVPGAGM